MRTLSDAFGLLSNRFHRSNNLNFATYGLAESPPRLIEEVHGSNVKHDVYVIYSLHLMLKQLRFSRIFDIEVRTPNIFHANPIWIQKQGRSQDFFGGGTLFQKIFKKYAKKFLKNFVKIFKKFQKKKFSKILNKVSKKFLKIFS